MSLGPSTKKVCLNDISLQVSKVGFLTANMRSRSSGRTNFTNSVEHFLRFFFAVSCSLLFEPRRFFGVALTKDDGYCMPAPS